MAISTFSTTRCTLSMLWYKRVQARLARVHLLFSKMVPNSSDGFRYQMEFSFPDDDSKKAFLNCLDCSKRMFKEKMKKSSIDNVEFMSCLCNGEQSCSPRF